MGKSAKEVIDVLHEAGLHLLLTANRGLQVSPARAITPELRTLIRENKLGLLAWLARDAANDEGQVPPVTPEDSRARPGDMDMMRAIARADTARQAHFLAKGLSPADAAHWSGRLDRRDMEGDDRRLCLECRHLAGTRPWRCAAWRRAGVALQASDATLGPDLVMALQRCPGFAQAQLERMDHGA